MGVNRFREQVFPTVHLRTARYRSWATRLSAPLLSSNITIDWTLRENLRAQLRVLVRRILRKHGYPPDKQEKATITGLEQAALLSEGWASAD